MLQSSHMKKILSKGFKVRWPVIVLIVLAAPIILIFGGYNAYSFYQTQHFTNVRNSLNLPNSLKAAGQTTEVIGIDVPDNVTFEYTFSADTADMHSQLRTLLKNDGYAITGDDTSTPSHTFADETSWYLQADNAKKGSHVYISATKNQLSVQLSDLIKY